MYSSIQQIFMDCILDIEEAQEANMDIGHWLYGYLIHIGLTIIHPVISKRNMKLSNARTFTKVSTNYHHD